MFLRFLPSCIIENCSPNVAIFASLNLPKMEMHQEQFPRANYWQSLKKKYMKGIKMKYPAILVVEDDPTLNQLLCLYLKSHLNSTTILGYLTGEGLIEELDKYRNPIIIQDYGLPGISGLDIIRKVKAKKPSVDFIFLSGQTSIEIALQALRYGAFDYIVKDSFAKENTILKVNYLLKIRRLKKEDSRNKFISIGLVIMSILVWLAFLIRYLMTQL